MPRALSLILILCVGAALAACSTPVLDIPEPKARHLAAAHTALDRSSLGPSRDLEDFDRIDAVNRIGPRVRYSAIAICQSLELPDEHCASVEDAIVNIHYNDEQLNAYADKQDEISILGGLIGASGRDEEIAAILAHEYAHIMYGHVEKKITNALVGMAIAGAIAAALTDRGASDEKMNKKLLHAGAAIGSRAYSPEMEIEADRTAIYILRDAGFPTSAMQEVIVRMHRIKARPVRGPFSGRVGFLETHPSNDRRVAHIISATEDAKAGVPLKVANPE